MTAERARLRVRECVAQYETDGSTMDQFVADLKTVLDALDAAERRAVLGESLADAVLAHPEDHCYAVKGTPPGTWLCPFCDNPIEPAEQHAKDCAVVIARAYRAARDAC